MKKVQKEITNLYLNLKDAGCSNTMIQSFLAFQEEHKSTEQIELLLIQRSRLLQKIHEYQKCLDCLDYLIFNIRKEIRNE